MFRVCSDCNVCVVCDLHCAVVEAECVCVGGWVGWGDSDVKYLLVVSPGNTFVATHVWLNLDTLLSIYHVEKSRF